MKSPQPTAPPKSLLRDVSRSFYLSIQILPAVLREPISVAYLLARATDTLADTAQLPTEERRDHLQTLINAIEGEAHARSNISHLSRSFAPLQTDAGERRLVERLNDCLEWLDQLAPADHADVLEVLRKITRGQMLDVERFGDTTQVHALATAEDLNEYTYLVAGCVGEFWTSLCFRHLPGVAPLPQAQMLELARSYGKALQLINILRDQAEDLRAGRRYIPADTKPAQWMEQAQQGLDAGMQYALALNNRRLRAASALPALIGVRTLALIDADGVPQAKVKVPRAEVRTICLRLLLSAASRSALTALYGQPRMGQSAP